MISTTPPIPIKDTTMTHPNPLTQNQVASHQAQAVVEGRDVVYMIGDEGTHTTVFVASCVYGFPSCVLVKYSLNNGITSEAWSPYGQGLGAEKRPYYDAMFEWVANTITAQATHIAPDNHPMAPFTNYSDIKRR